MLYDFQKQQWSHFTDEGEYWTTSWSHDSKSAYMYHKSGDQSAELVRISVVGFQKLGTPS